MTSWIITNKKTGRRIFETYSEETVNEVREHHKDTLEAIPIAEWLAKRRINNMITPDPIWDNDRYPGELQGASDSNAVLGCAGKTMNCQDCGKPLTPAPAIRDGQPTTVGYLPCACSRIAWLNCRCRDFGASLADHKEFCA